MRRVLHAETRHGAIRLRSQTQYSTDNTDCTHDMVGGCGARDIGRCGDHLTKVVPMTWPMTRNYTALVTLTCSTFRHSVEFPFHEMQSEETEQAGKPQVYGDVRLGSAAAGRHHISRVRGHVDGVLVWRLMWRRHDMVGVTARHCQCDGTTWPV